MVCNVQISIMAGYVHFTFIQLLVRSAIVSLMTALKYGVLNITLFTVLLVSASHQNLATNLKISLQNCYVQILKLASIADQRKVRFQLEILD